MKENSKEEAGSSEHGSSSEIIVRHIEFLEGSFFFSHATEFLFLPAFYWRICRRETTLPAHRLPNTQVSLTLRLLCE